MPVRARHDAGGRGRERAAGSASETERGGAGQAAHPALISTDVASETSKYYFNIYLMQIVFKSSCGDANPLGFLSLFNPVGLANSTSLLGALALAHAEHTVAKLNALAALLWPI
ncbi:hypothetical protein RR48_04299 [Papilio machaon]|uniref:Uncharacterized protein n=1 Tax=Papilio machaon TaxID=76193 RepID=A0A0N1IGN4_PAPMA|nr:hypothetical protein RR48_04299 [Papilio machaon]